MKKKVLLIIGLLLMLIAPIVYAMYASTISIAAIAAKWITDNQLTVDAIKSINMSLNKSIFFDLAIYTIFQLFNYIFYLFKKNKATIIAMIIELLVVATCLFIYGEEKLFIGFILMVPIINNILYLIINKNITT